METFDADKINKELYETLANEIEGMCKKAERISESDVREGIKVIDPIAGIRILESDETKYDALVRLQEVLKFKNIPSNNIYEFPGMKLNGKSITLFVNKDKVGRLADMGEYFERELSYLGLKFPTQLYQFKKENLGQKLPGKDYPAPEPKTKEMTNAEYEKYLEDYYSTHGINKEADEAAFRRPYPHEKINYQEGNVEKEGFTNEYYSEELKRHAEGKGTTIKAPVGERIKVTNKTLKRPALFDQEDRVVNSQKWSKVGSFVIKSAAFAAGVAGAFWLAHQAPILLGVAAAGVGIAVGRYLLKLSKRKKSELKEAERERRRKEREAREAAEKAKTKEKEKDKGEAPGLNPPTTPTRTPGGTSTPPTTPTITPGGTSTPPTTPTITPGGTSTPPTTPTRTPGGIPSGTTDDPGFTWTPSTGPSKSGGYTWNSPGKTNTGGTDSGAVPPTTPTETQIAPDKEPQVPNYDDLIYAEQEMALDQAEIARIDREISIIVEDVKILLRSTNPEDKTRLQDLQDQLASKYSDRMSVIYTLIERQQRAFNSIGVNLGR